MKVLSLFCGCGGMDLGLLGGFEYLGQPYSSLDYSIVKAIDNDQYCTRIYNENFEHKCEVMDVRDLDISTLPDFDLLIGGFPCQSFSISAQNPPRLGYKDERGMLFFEMVKILKEKKPRFLIAENVKGLLSANKGKAFPMIIQEFEKAGYHIKFKLLNASEYGIPQKRQRVLIIGFRDDEDYNNFKFPSTVTSREKIPLRAVLNFSDNQNERLFFSERAVAGMMQVREKMNKGRVQSLDEPCNTISSHMAKVSLNSTDPVLFVNGRYRRFSSEECARIQSFPENFKWNSVSESKQLKAIGNAVPPVLMWYIANALMETINHQPQSISSEDEIPNGDFTQTYVQLTLFEPESIYLGSSAKGSVLIGSCRTGIIDWIKEKQKYCYPLSDDESDSASMLSSVIYLLVLHKKTLVGFYKVISAEVVLKPELNAYSYPMGSSRRKADSRYILYDLQPANLYEVKPDWQSFRVIAGKGTSS